MFFVDPVAGGLSYRFMNVWIYNILNSYLKKETFHGCLWYNLPINFTNPLLLRFPAWCFSLH